MKVLKNSLKGFAFFSLVIGLILPFNAKAMEIVADPVEILDARLNTYSLVVAFGEVVVRRDDLENGMIVISGRFSHIDNIEKVLFSEDAGMTWKQLETDINFVAEITPLAEKRYEPLIRLVSSDGTEADYKVFPNINSIVYKDIDYKGMVIEAIRNISEAYERQSVSMFSRLVSVEYLGNKVFLDEGVRFDFDMFTDIRLVIYIEKITREGKLFVAEGRWDKKQVPRSTAQQQMTSGRTTFVFKIEDGQMKIYNLRGNLIYATLSPEIAEASGLGTAIVDAVRTAHNNRTATQPGAGTTEDAGGTASNLSVLLGTVESGWFYDLSANIMIPANGDFENNALQIDPQGNPGWVLSSDFNNLVEAPADGYNPNITPGAVTVGQVYIYKTTAGEYAKFEITAIDGINFSFKYALQTDGTRNLTT